MTAHSPAPWPARTAALADLAQDQRLTVVLLRLWCAAGPNALSQVLTQAFGPADAATDAFHRLCLTRATQGTPMRHHGPGCPCLSQDEAAFAALLSAAADPDDDNALLLAFDCVTAPAAPCLLAEARQAALSLRRLTLRHTTPPHRLH